MDSATLQTVAKAMVAHGKGILAIDESTGTCQKRFDAVGVECSEENRRQYRQLLVSAPGIEEAISGMILYDETLRQKADDGTPFVEVLKRKGIIPGIKADKGPKDLALHPGEVVTEGLDGLRERLTEYKNLGAQFAKWRAVITIQGTDLPTQACLVANGHALARYAALCQEVGLVPMVEPEIMLDGDHSIERCHQVTAATLKELFRQLTEQGVLLEGTILKVSMVLAGNKAASQSSIAEIAQATVKCLTENVPHNVAGVVFLSGGQSEEASTLNLNAMNQLGSLPWPLSFSYGRGIQAPALDLWSKDIHANVAAAQTVLVHRAKMNGLAAQGTYSPELDQL